MINMINTGKASIETASDRLVESIKFSQEALIAFVEAIKPFDIEEEDDDTDM